MLMMLAGYETTGNSMIFLAYNLAANPDKQEKLRQEIDETVEKFVSASSWLRIFFLRNQNSLVFEEAHLR